MNNQLRNYDHDLQRDDYDDGDVLDPEARAQKEKIKPHGAVMIHFHIAPESSAPFVSIYMKDWHFRKPGAPSVGRTLLAALNAIGAVKGGPGR